MSNKPIPAYDDPRPGCEAVKPCHRLCDHTSPECPRHKAMAIARAEKKAAERAAKLAPDPMDSERRQA